MEISLENVVTPIFDNFKYNQLFYQLLVHLHHIQVTLDKLLNS